MKIVLVGEGAIARKHLASIARIDQIEVASLAGGIAGDTEQLACEAGIGHWSLDLAECLAQPGIDAAILTTPTQLHVTQALTVLDAGKHVLIEIPMADNLADAEELVRAAESSGLVAMVCHTRRFRLATQWIRSRMLFGELSLQHLMVETKFFRRENTNAMGKPRTWVDHLLWHHACHSVDLFQYLTGEIPDRVAGVQGPIHPEFGIAMDMAVSLTSPSGAMMSVALSFNNDGPFGTKTRYICDNGTYVQSYDDLVDGYDNPIDVSAVDSSADGIEAQEREFLAAVTEGREPNASVQQGIAAMRTLHRIEQTLAE